MVRFVDGKCKIIFKAEMKTTNFHRFVAFVEAEKMKSNLTGSINEVTKKKKLVLRRFQDFGICDVGLKYNKL